MPPAPPANFDRLARLYAPLEWLSFGRALSRRRLHFIDDPRVARARRALVLGDGDGRFSAALLARYPSLELTAVDASAQMLTQLERRVRTQTPHAALTLCCADLRHWAAPAQNFDLVVSHFVFDCLTTQELDTLIARVTPALAPRACWLISDFAIPQLNPWHLLARLLVRTLYFGFRVLTGLTVTRLPDHAPLLRSHHFQLASADTACGGILRSELWQRATERPV